MDPAPVSRRVSPMDRGRPDRLDVRHSIQCPWRAASGLMSPGWTAFNIPVHRREKRRGPRSIQGADGLEGGLAEESPCAARRVVLGGSVRLVRLHYRVRYQAPDGRLLRSPAGSGELRPVSPSARHGAGSAKRGGGWGSGRKHVRQVRDGRGVPQVHVDPQEGSARGARAFV